MTTQSNYRVALLHPKAVFAVVALLIYAILSGCQPEARKAPPAPLETTAQPSTMAVEAVSPAPAGTEPAPNTAPEATAASLPAKERDNEEKLLTEATAMTGPNSTESSEATPAATPTAPSNVKFRENRSNLDPTNPSINMLQRPGEALSHLPLDSYGRINWVKALQSGLITPRARIEGSGKMEIKQEAVIMKETLAMPYVRFPHLEHTQWLACSNCHPIPFKAEEGANKISMDSIMRGEHCGTCHERVAFSIMACERCHSITHPGSPKKWW